MKYAREHYLIAEFAHEASANRFSRHTPDVGKMFLLNENYKHHANQTDQLHFPVFSFGMESTDNSTQPFVFARRLVKKKGLFAQI